MAVHQKSPAYEAAQFLKELGKAVKKRRKEKKLRFVDLWALTGLQPSSIRAIEGGQYYHFIKIFTLLRVLGIELVARCDGEEVKI